MNRHISSKKQKIFMSYTTQQLKNVCSIIHDWYVLFVISHLTIQLLLVGKIEWKSIAQIATKCCYLATLVVIWLLQHVMVKRSCKSISEFSIKSGFILMILSPQTNITPKNSTIILKNKMAQSHFYHHHHWMKISCTFCILQHWVTLADTTCNTRQVANISKKRSKSAKL